MWVAHIDNQCVGYIHFLLEPNKRIKFMDAWVHEDHRRKGIFRSLWDIRWNYVNKHYKNYIAYAWCTSPSNLSALKQRNAHSNLKGVATDVDLDNCFTRLSTSSCDV